MSEWVNKEETIKKMCAIITGVGDHFNNDYSHDCICGENPISNCRVGSIIIEFIEDAVKEKMCK